MENEQKPFQALMQMVKNIYQDTAVTLKEFTPNLNPGIDLISPNINIANENQIMTTLSPANAGSSPTYIFAVPSIDGGSHLSVADLNSGKIVLSEKWLTDMMKENSTELSAELNYQKLRRIILLNFGALTLKRDLGGFQKLNFDERKAAERLIREHIESAGEIDTGRMSVMQFGFEKYISYRPEGSEIEINVGILDSDEEYRKNNRPFSGALMNEMYLHMYAITIEIFQDFFENSHFYLNEEIKDTAYLTNYLPIQERIPDDYSLPVYFPLDILKAAKMAALSGKTSLVEILDALQSTDFNKIQAQFGLLGSYIGRDMLAKFVKSFYVYVSLKHFDDVMDISEQDAIDYNNQNRFFLTDKDGKTTIFSRS